MFFGNLPALIDIKNPPKPTLRSPLLAAGDILVKMADNSVTNGFISFAESFTLTGHRQAWTHAGLATSSNTISEMDSHGLQHHHLSGENSGYIYSVFRCKFDRIARSAWEADNVLRKHKDRVTYNYSGLAGSLFPTVLNVETNLMKDALKQMDSGKNFSLFCSEHVVFCYQVAIETNPKFTLADQIPDLLDISPPVSLKNMFGKRAWEYTPAYLYEQLIKSAVFDYLGRWKGTKWIA